MAKGYVITNMVAAGNLGISLDLYRLSLTMPSIEYEPEQFPGAILKFDKPKATLLVFKNGKVVCVGCRSEEEIESTLKKALKILLPKAKIIMKRMKIPEYEVTNIVAAANLNIELDLFTIAYKERDVEYEPEQFPGAILKFKKPKVSLLLFKNGKVIIAGAKKESEIRTSLNLAREMLKRYAKK
ncbi:MAG: hypothetical protein QXL47_02995 [Candidatus Anstonellales archaeon]